MSGIRAAARINMEEGHRPPLETPVEIATVCLSLSHQDLAKLYQIMEHRHHLAISQTIPALINEEADRIKEK